MNFDQHHKARPLKLLKPGQRAWISYNIMRMERTVKQQISYLVTMAQGTVCRNRCHLKYYPQSCQDEAICNDSDDEAIEEITFRLDQDLIVSGHMFCVLLKLCSFSTAIQVTCLVQGCAIHMDYMYLKVSMERLKPIVR